MKTCKHCKAEYDCNVPHTCDASKSELNGGLGCVVGEYTEREMVRRAVMNARPRTCGESPRWVAVKDTFALGSTYAYMLCRNFGLDPDEMVSGARCISCNP